jgi:hypothetical protein
MPNTSSANSKLLKFQPNTPRSFLERGVAAPFTTALLSGARLRRLTRIAGSLNDREVKGEPLQGFATLENGRPGIEVVVPNPSGARGVYVMLWSDVGALCRPTMHDVAMCEHLVARTNPMLPLTPLMVRKAARDAALRGLAGRLAAQAARTAVEQEALQAVATRRALFAALLKQTEAPGTSPPAHLLSEAELEARGKAALEMIAQRHGRKVQDITGHFAAMAEVLVDIGFGEAKGSARLPGVLSAMAMLRNELLPLGKVSKGESFIEASGASALQIATAADAAISMAVKPLAMIDLRLRSIETLLDEMMTEPRLIQDLVEQPDWIADGWARICDIWTLAVGQGSHAQALAEIHALVPVLPDELEGWLGLAAGSTAEINSRNAPVGTVWRAEVSNQDRVARNEHLRAMAR